MLWASVPRPFVFGRRGPRKGPFAFRCITTQSQPPIEPPPVPMVLLLACVSLELYDRTKLMPLKEDGKRLHELVGESFHSTWDWAKRSVRWPSRRTRDDAQ